MTWLWTVSALTPLATALALLLLAADPVRGEAARLRLVRFAPASLVPVLVLTVLGPSSVGTLDVPWVFFGTTASLDSVGRPLLLVATVLYAAALSATSARGTDRPAVMSALLLVCFVGNATVFVAADAATFYLGYAVMSVCAYGLVVHSGTAPARRAGRVYLALTMLSEMAVLVAVLLVVDAGGSRLVDAPAAVAASPHTSVIVVLLILGFGIKCGLFPLHEWLPLAHPAAPPPGSAVLSGAMIKAGLVGWLRFLPLGEVALPVWSSVLIVLALVSAFAALVPGALTRDPKVALAYSSISQMGFLGVLVGVALGAPELADACVLAAVLYAVHHGMAKGGLFLSVTVWRLHGSGPWRGVVLAGMALLALAVAGAPLGSGAVAKYAGKSAVASAEPGLVDVTAVLPFVGTVSTLLLVRAAFCLLRSTEPEPRGVDQALVSWTVLVLGGTVATWYLAGTWSPVVSVPQLDAVTVWDATWPILLGLVVAGAVWAVARSGRLPRQVSDELVPAGDLIVPVERLVGATVRAADRGAARVGTWRDAVQTRTVAAAKRVPVSVLDRAEDRLTGWVPSGVAVLVVASVVGVVLAVTR